MNVQRLVVLVFEWNEQLLLHFIEERLSPPFWPDVDHIIERRSAEQAARPLPLAKFLPSRDAWR